MPGLNPLVRVLLFALGLPRRHVVYENGAHAWYHPWHYTQLHRVGGPAIIWPDGSRFWYRNGRPHRDDGPAIEWADGTSEWYRNGIRVEAHA